MDLVLPRKWPQTTQDAVLESSTGPAGVAPECVVRRLRHKIGLCARALDSGPFASSCIRGVQIGCARGVQSPSRQGRPPELSSSQALADTGGTGRF